MKELEVLGQLSWEKEDEENVKENGVFHVVGIHRKWYRVWGTEKPCDASCDCDGETVNESMSVDDTVYLRVLRQSGPPFVIVVPNMSLLCPCLYLDAA